MFHFIMVGSLFSGFSVFVRKAIPKNDKDCETLFLNPHYMLEMMYMASLTFFGLMAVTKPIEFSSWLYRVMVIVFGFFMTVATISTVVYFFHEGLKTMMGWILLFVTVAYFIIPPVLRLKNLGLKNIPYYMLGSFFLLLLTPTYVNIIITYSMANLHDVSWGN